MIQILITGSTGFIGSYLLKKLCKKNKIYVILRKKRKISKDIMVVTGRADISVILNSSIDEINNVVIDLKNVKEIVGTETLIEVEVDLGW